MKKQTVEVTLPASLEFSCFVRETSKLFFLQVGFSKEWAQRLTLVLDELFTNAYKYGSKKEEGRIFIQLSFDQTHTYFCVEDEGRGDEKVSVEELEADINRNAKELNDLGKKSGRGLALISTLWADELNLQNSLHGGLLVGIQKVISKEVPPPFPTFDLASASEKRIQKVLHSSELSVMPKGPTHVVALDGEVHSGNINEKVQPVLHILKDLPNGAILVLDCQGLNYLNSTFIGYLASWYNQMQQKEGHLVLKNTNHEVRNVLNLVGLSRVVFMEQDK